MNTSTTADDMNLGKNGGGQTRAYGGRSSERTRSASPEFATLVSDVEVLLQKIGYIADTEVAQLRERLKTKIVDVKENLTTQAMPIARAARNAAGATDDYVRQNPWQSTGMAVLLGVVVGFIFLRR